MTTTDADQVIYGALEAAKLAGVMPRHLFTPEHVEWLTEAQDEIARALEKARKDAA